MTSLLGLMLIATGSLMIGLAPSNAYFLAIGAMFVVGFALPITNGPLLAVVQAVVAPEMQGRVLTLLNSVAMGMSPLGLIIAGPLADTFSVQSWFVVSGIATALMGVAGLFIPAVMNLEQGRQTPENSSPARPALAASPAEGD